MRYLRRKVSCFCSGQKRGSFMNTRRPREPRRQCLAHRQTVQAVLHPHALCTLSLTLWATIRQMVQRPRTSSKDQCITWNGTSQASVQSLPLRVLHRWLAWVLWMHNIVLLAQIQGPSACSYHKHRCLGLRSPCIFSECPINSMKESCRSSTYCALLHHAATTLSL